jgi:hypothetical protein
LRPAAARLTMTCMRGDPFVPAGRPDDAPAGSIAPGWKCSSKLAEYAWWWDGEQYTTGARWDGSSWTYINLAPGWRWRSQEGAYAWWDGKQYTTRARWDGSSWEYTDIREEPTTNGVLAGWWILAIVIVFLLFASADPSCGYP